MWMSSSAGSSRSCPPRSRPRPAAGRRRSPWRRPPEMMPCLASIAAWARLARMSSRHNRLSTRDRGIYLAHHRGRAASKAPAPHYIGVARAADRPSPVSPRASMVAGCDRQKARGASSARRGSREARRGSIAATRARRRRRSSSRTPTAASSTWQSSRARRCWSIFGPAGARPASRSCRRFSSWSRPRPTRASSASSPSARTWRPQGSVEAFLGERDIGRFAAYHDAEDEADRRRSASRSCRRRSSTTRKGKEVWRYVGDLDWTGEEAAKLLAELKRRPKAKR